MALPAANIPIGCVTALLHGLPKFLVAFFIADL